MRYDVLRVDTEEYECLREVAKRAPLLGGYALRARG